MATILNEHMTGIGWAVDFLSGGQTSTIYFPTQPSAGDRDERIRFYEQLWTDDAVAAKQLDTEEVDA
jgi:hypothetical protein